MVALIHASMLVKATQVRHIAKHCCQLKLPSPKEWILWSPDSSALYASVAKPGKTFSQCDHFPAECLEVFTFSGTLLSHVCWLLDPELSVGAALLIHHIDCFNAKSVLALSLGSNILRNYKCSAHGVTSSHVPFLAELHIIHSFLSCSLLKRQRAARVTIEQPEYYLVTTFLPPWELVLYFWIHSPSSSRPQTELKWVFRQIMTWMVLRVLVPLENFMSTDFSDHSSTGILAFQKGLLSAIGSILGLL